MTSTIPVSITNVDKWLNSAHLHKHLQVNSKYLRPGTEAERGYQGSSSFIQEEQRGFLSGSGNLDQLQGCWRELVGECPHGFTQPAHMCFVDLEKAYVQEYGVDGPLQQTIQSLYSSSQSLVDIENF